MAAQRSHAKSLAYGLWHIKSLQFANPAQERPSRTLQAVKLYSAFFLAWRKRAHCLGDDGPPVAFRVHRISEPVMNGPDPAKEAQGEIDSSASVSIRVHPWLEFGPKVTTPKKSSLDSQALIEI
jgi:hypothetical protein